MNRYVWLLLGLAQVSGMIGVYRMENGQPYSAVIFAVGMVYSVVLAADAGK